MTDVLERQAAEWTAAQVNDFPDSSFLYIKPGGTKDSDGKTVPRTNRMFPYRDGAGKVDLPHLRNALARIPQADIPADVKARVSTKARDLLDQANNAAEPTVDDVHVPGLIGEQAAPKNPHFLRRIYNAIKETFSQKAAMTREEFLALHVQARGHAGGKAKAEAQQQQQQAADWLGSPGVWPTEPMPEPVDEPMDDEDECEPVVLFEKADKRVNYRPAKIIGQTCGDCQNFDEECASCRLVEGTINELAVCDLFQPETEDEPQPAMMHELFDLCAVHRASDPPDLPLSVPTGGGESGSSPPPSYRLFAELRAFTTPPDWIPLLPRPGRYEHPSYGTITITPERVERFVANFNAGVYQKPVPIDAEHETALSGALGWITELRVNADGSADGRSEWTDRGRLMLTGDAFRYVSPTWYDLWRDPATGKKYQDIVSGAALCRKPFFKPPNLRPLVASEGGLAVPDPDPDPAILTGANVSLGSTSVPVTFHATTITSPRPSSEAPLRETRERGPAVSDQTTQQPPPAPVPPADDVQRRYTEMEAKFAALEATNAQREAALKQASERIEAMERQERRKRFTDIVLGRGGNGDGVRWFGEVDKHVGRLEKLASAWGEDSDEFREFVADQQAAAERLHESGFYKELGTGATGRPTEAARFEVEARKYAEENGLGRGPVAEAKAMEQMLERDPALYQRLLAEEKGG